MALSLLLVPGIAIGIVVAVILVGISIGRSIRAGYGWVIGLALLILGLGLQSNWGQSAGAGEPGFGTVLAFLGVVVMFTPGKRKE